MSIDFKPAVRFLEKMVDKGAEISKDISAYTKHHKAWTGFIVLAFGGLAILHPATTPLLPLVAYAMSQEGKSCQQDERNKVLAARAKAPGFAEGPSQP